MPSALRAPARLTAGVRPLQTGFESVKYKLRKQAMANRLWIVGALTLTMVGCAGNIKLIEDGKVHSGKYDQLSKTIEITIDGVPYKGTYSQNASTGFGTTVAGTQVATGVITMRDGSGQALLLSPEGKVLRCRFGAVVAWRGQGQCQNNDGKLYDLLIGQ